MQLQAAYETISDPEKRRVYDIRWPGIRDNSRAQQEANNRQAEAAEAEKKRAAEERAKKQKEDGARQERLRPLELSKSRYDGDIFELGRVIRKLNADLRRLQEQDDEDAKKERELKSWWTYVTSPIYGKLTETDAEKQKRATERLHRLASKSIKGSELREKLAKLGRLEDALRDVSDKIAAEKRKADDEARLRTQERKRRMEEEANERVQQELRDHWARFQREQEARQRAEEEIRDQRAKWQKEQAERAAEAARQADEARERVRKHAAAEQHREEERR